MPKISLTSFVDIVSASGTSKLSKVRKIKNRPAYTPGQDFYRPFRNHVIDIHQQGLSKSELRSVLDNLTDAKKDIHYPSLVNGYRRWWGRKNLEWFNPPKNVWTAHTIGVRVNPELGLIVNGRSHIIKLYMKAEKLSKNRIDIIIHLMESCLSSQASQNAVICVLDVRRSKLISPTVSIPGLSAALDGELAYIGALWPQV